MAASILVLFNDILFLGNLGIPQLLVPRALRSTVPSSDSVALAMAGPVKMIRGMIWTSQVNHMKTFEARSLLHSLFFCVRQKGGEEEWVEVGDRVSTLALPFSLSLYAFSCV